MPSLALPAAAQASPASEEALSRFMLLLGCLSVRKLRTLRRSLFCFVPSGLACGLAKNTFTCHVQVQTGFCAVQEPQSASRRTSGAKFVNSEVQSAVVISVTVNSRGL